MTPAGTSTNALRPTDTEPSQTSPRSEGHGAQHSPGNVSHERRRSLSAPLERLSTLSAARPGRRDPSPPPAPPPVYGYWTRLLAGLEIDDEPATQSAPQSATQSAAPERGADAPGVARETPPNSPASERFAAPRRTAWTITADQLLAIAHAAQHLPIAAAARACGVDGERIVEILRKDGLTERGLRAAGDKAIEINRLMQERPTTVSSRRPINADIDGARLLAIAQSARTTTIAAAAREHNADESLVGRYLTMRGLTEIGRRVAGPLADQIDRAIETRDPQASLPRRLPPMTREVLLSLVEAAHDQPLEAAAQALSRTLSEIDAYIAPWGLTHAGRWVAGDQADALDDILYQRYLAHGGAGATLDGMTLPAVPPPAMRRRPGDTGALRPGRRVTLPMLLAVAQATTSEGSITRACKACGVNPGTIATYLGVRGLTADGRAVAGNWADRIHQFMRMLAQRHLARPRLHPQTRAGERGDPQPPGREAPEADAYVPEPVGAHLTNAGASATREASGKKAGAPTPLPVAPDLPPLDARRNAIDAIDLVAIARLSTTMSISEAAARLNFSVADVSPFLTIFGLTAQGRLAAGPHAAEIDRFTASRLEHLSALYSDIQAQGHSLASLREDPFVRELMEMIGHQAGQGTGAPPARTKPSAPTGRPASIQAPAPAAPPIPTTPPAPAEPTAPILAPAPTEQPAPTAPPVPTGSPVTSERPAAAPTDTRAAPESEQTQQRKPRGRKRLLETGNMGRATRVRRAAAAETRSPSPDRDAVDALLNLARVDGPAPQSPVGPLADGREAVDMPAGSTARGVAKVDADVLSRVSRLAQSMPITRAGLREGLGKRSIWRYFKSRTLTARGREVAGERAGEIEALLAAGKNNMRTITGRNLLRVAKAVGREGSIRRAAIVSGINPRTIKQFVGLRGLKRSGLALAGPLADEINQLISAHHSSLTAPQAGAASAPERTGTTRGDRTAARDSIDSAATVTNTPDSESATAGNSDGEFEPTRSIGAADDTGQPEGSRNRRVTAQRLLEVARLSKTIPIAKAALRAGFTTGQLSKFMRRNKLTAAGRQRAGKHANEIESMLNNRPLLRGSAMAEALLKVAKRVAQGELISRAAKAERIGGKNIAQLLGRQGLTKRGKNLAGQLAQDIDGFMRKAAERREAAKANKTGVGTSNAGPTASPEASDAPILTGSAVETADEHQPAEQSQEVPAAALDDRAAHLTEDIFRPSANGTSIEQIGPRPEQSPRDPQ